MCPDHESSDQPARKAALSNVVSLALDGAEGPVNPDSRYGFLSLSTVGESLQCPAEKSMI